MREGEIGDRLEILDRIVGQVFVERRIDRHRLRESRQIVEPSGGAALQALAAMMVLAPARLSTTKP